MPRPAPYTPQQLARLIEMAPTCTDPVIAAELGFKPAKVLHIRTKLGIPGCYRSRRPQAWIDAVRARYVEGGEPAADVGRDLGITATSVRRIASENGMKRRPGASFANSAAANRRRAVSRPRPPAPPPKILVSANDHELIAAFLAEKAITVLPPGTACGLSRMEREFHAAYPISASLKAQGERGRALLAAKRARAA